MTVHGAGDKPVETGTDVELAIGDVRAPESIAGSVAGSRAESSGHPQHRGGGWPRSSVRKPPPEAPAGPTPVPDLLGQWRRATVEAAIKRAALADIEPQIQAARDRVMDDATAELGQPPEPQAIKPAIVAAIKAVKRTQLPHAELRARRAITQSPETIEETIAEAIAAADRRFIELEAQGKNTDPLSPLARATPSERTGEITLWENRAFVVLAHRGPTAKALVIPKREMRTPLDATDAELDQMARIAAAVSDAFRRAGARAPAEISINAAQRRNVKQLHAYVAPRSENFTKAARLALGSDPSPEALSAAIELEKKKYYPAVQSALAQRLGKSVLG